MDDRVAVEVVYALPDRQSLIRVELPPGTSLREAVMQSGMLNLHPELSGTDWALGIHGRQCPAGNPAKAGDRIEIYRPLAIDPKDSRHQRVREKRKSPRMSGR